MTTTEQQLSIFDVMDTDTSVVANAIRRIVPGTEFSINTLRAELDRAGFPDTDRQKAMRGACADGLCAVVKYWSEELGREVPKKVPSTGKSAHGASVAVYRRLSPEEAR